MRTLPAISISLALAACGRTGLGQATLLRDCAAGDPSCHRVGPLAPLAVGATFHPNLATELAGSTTPSLTLTTADPGIVDVDGGGLVGRAPGVAAVVMSVDSGVVFDFIHVWVAQPTSVTLERDTGERVMDELDLVTGEEVKLAPAVWNKGQRLEGASALAWTVHCDGACPIAVLRDGTPDRRRLRAQRPGKATVVVAGLGLTETLSIEVVP